MEMGIGGKEGHPFAFLLFVIPIDRIFLRLMISLSEYDDRVFLRTR
jgi:hypothetical protein